MTVGLNVTPDPDPTPTATPWQEYLAAAQSLDAVVREAASEAAATAQAVRDDLARLQAELDRQRAALLAAAAAAGLPAPPLLPGPAEQAAAEERLPSADPATVAEALRHCERLIAAADAHLGAGLAGTGPGPAGPVTGPLPPVPPPAVPPMPAGPVTGGLPVASAPVPSSPSGPSAPLPPPPGRGWWPPPAWFWVAAPLGSATLLLCLFSLILLGG